MNFASIIDLGAPHSAAITTYGFFRYMDRRGGRNARSQITNFIRTSSVAKIDIHKDVLRLFYGVYGLNIFSFTSFLISAFLSTISLLIWMIFYYHVMHPDRGSVVAFFQAAIRRGLFVSWLVNLAGNILTDYAALFAIRYILISTRIHSVIGTYKAALYALAATLIVVQLVFLVQMPLELVFEAHVQIVMLPKYVLGEEIDFLQNLTTFDLAQYACLFPYLWIAFLAFGMTVIKAGQLTMLSSMFLQRYLEHGREHPVEAVGFIAAAVVFLGTTCMQLLARFW